MGDPQPATPPAVERLGLQPDGGGEYTAIWFSPHGLSGTRWSQWAFVGCAAGLLTVFLVGLAVPKSVETLPVALLIVVAAAWLLSTRQAFGITIVAVALPVAAVVARELDPTSAAVQAAVFTLLAIGTRLYSTRLRRLLTGSGGPPVSMAASAFGLENLAHLVEGATQGIAAIDDSGGIRYANDAASALLGLAKGDPLVRNFYASLVSQDADRVRAAFQTAPSDTYMTFAIRRPDGSLRTVQATHTALVVRGEPMVALALRDISLVSQLQRAASALAETAAGLAATRKLDDTMGAIAGRVTEVTGACACAVFLVEPNGQARLAGSVGLPPGYEAAANRAIKAGANPPVYQAMRTKAPVVVENLPRVIRTEDHMAPLRAVVQDVAWEHAIAFPMIHADRAVGGLAVYLRPGHHLDQPTMEFLSTIAGQAASAAEISRLFSLAQDQAAANERLHLSRELHDSLSQRLYGIILGARSIERRLAGPGGEAADAIAYIVDLAQDGLNEMRDIVLQMRPESLERDGLVAAVARHADAIGSRHQLEVIKVLALEPALSLDTKLTAYRIALEALNNAAKHASAHRIRVRVEVVDEHLEVEVSDDGKGFDLSIPTPGHFGLDTMRERAAAHGGQVSLFSTPGSGTRVLVSLPAGETVDAHETVAS